VLLAESLQLPAPGVRTLGGTVDSELAGWLKQHRYLQPVEVAQGESSMALLLLWEVEHGCTFPSLSADRTGALTGFTRRLMKRVAADDELKEWVVTKEVQHPLAPGLPDTHHTRWSIRVCPPSAGEPQGWYTEFIARWRSYLGTLAQPVGRHTVPTPSSSNSLPSPALPLEAPSSRRRPRSAGANAEPLARRRPPSRRPRQEGIDSAVLENATSSTAISSPAPRPVPAAPTRTGGPHRPRSPPTPVQSRPTKRQRDMRAWLQPKPGPALMQTAAPPQQVAPPSLPEHGRASQGPPT
jgi:hypothetical protein